MLFHKSLIVLMALMFLQTGCAYSSGQTDCKKLYYNVLNEKLRSDQQGQPKTMDMLYSLKESCGDEDILFVDLLDYYLGSASGAVISETLTEKGTSIVPLLEQKKTQPLRCEDRYSSICLSSAEKRNRKIDYLLESISKGEILKVAE